MLYSLLSLMVLAATAVAQTSTGNITYVFTPVGGNTSPLGFQCSNGLWTVFGLTVNVQVYVNGVGPNSPMAETGLPTIQTSWFVNGVASNVAYTSAFGVANVSSSANHAFFTLEDDQSPIGGTIAVGACTQGQTQPPITVAMSSSSFIVGQGFTSPFIPAASGVPNIVNNFNAANNAGGSTGGSATVVPATSATTSAPVATHAATVAPTTAALTVAPTKALTVAPTTATTGTTGNITYVITPQGLSFQCSNGKWTDFGLTLNVQVYVNGVGPNPPMAETGLPTIQFSWFIAGAAANATLTNAFNVANVVSTGNAVSFSLEDDQPSIGGTFAVGTCTQAQTLPAITVSMTSNSFIVGQGVAPNIPAVSGVPHIVNGFPAANNAGSVFDQDANPTATSSSSSSSSSQTPLIAAAIGIVAFGCVAGLAVVGIRRHKQRKNQEHHLLTSPTRESQLSVYVAQKE